MNGEYMASKGKLARISGPVVVAKGLGDAKLYDVVKVGEEGLSGEIIKIVGDSCVVQVYEELALHGKRILAWL